jgi:hypothetical protein
MRRLLLAIAVAALAAAPALATAGQTTPFAAMSDHYEAIRQALLHDTTKGVAGHAKAIADEAATLEGSLESAETAVPADRKADCAALLPDIQDAARELAAADGLEQARASFGELSKPMVRYREMVPGERPMVVYCPMAKKPWLQPSGEIGNPYYGQSMARCGKIIAD